MNKNHYQLITMQPSAIEHNIALFVMTNKFLFEKIFFNTRKKQK